jgi:F-type H+-transporting ATPase subunit a
MNEPRGFPSCRGSSALLKVELVLDFAKIGGNGVLSESACTDGIRRKSKTKMTVVFFAAIFVGLTVSARGAVGVEPKDISAALIRTGSSGNSQQGEAILEEATAEEEEEHGLSQKADDITRILGLPISNSMIVTWIVAVGLIAFAQFATRNMKQVPDGAQNFSEWLVEGLYKFIEGVIGPHLTERTFWFFATIFIFILSANWVGLIPGVGSIGWGHETAHGFKIDQPLFRGANADVNLTFAMALVFFACWIVWALREVGPLGVLKELFGPKGDTTGLLKLLMVVVFFVAGCLEVISILFRPVSLSFRLYGNIFAGENMLEAMAKLVPHFGWLVQIPFYFLELLMGLVQALVFMLLTAVFTVLICQHEEGSTEAQV